MTDGSSESPDPDLAGQVRCEPASGGYRVVLIGEVDLTLADEWNVALATLAEAEPCDVTVDLSATTFVDSSTLGRLVRVNRLVAERGRDTVLTGANRAVARTLQLAGLDSVIRMVAHDG